MMLVEETSVPSAALPVEEFKAHLRLGSGFSDESLQDSVLESFLRAAMAAIEARTGKVLLERSFSWTLVAWRNSCAQPLPTAPVNAIESVSLEDRLGEQVVVAPSAYHLFPDLQSPELRPVGNALPTIPNDGRVVVGFLAGYGPEWSDLPADLQQAVLLLAAHYYEYRDETALSGGCMPFGVTSLIARYRPVRLGAGR
ncbi:head-tail connector protein [Shimia thalassica]|uniref:head-tail connector protein n=1 Tax=Shimia thalassica TaxID=1715693 RepID=UPI0026E4379B|nr:head-tail connector protein [Shimia thalassica]MDO6478083.1 head-tail connector protein [Shimia thalassica]